MYPVKLLCRLMEVSRSGFYEYLRRPKDDGQDPLIRRVKAIHEETRGSYGSRRMAKQLQEEGHGVGRHRARSLMRKAGC